MAVVLSGKEVSSRLRSLTSSLEALRVQRMNIDRQAADMETAGYTSGAIQTAINALLVDWGATRDQIVTELTAIPIVHQVRAKIGMPALYESAVIDAADVANGGNATIRVNETSDNLASPFSGFQAADVVTISNAENSANNISAILSLTPETAGTQILQSFGFDSATGWTEVPNPSGNVAITGSAAVFSGATTDGLKQLKADMTIPWTNNDYYLVRVSVSAWTAGTVNIGTNTTAAQGSAGGAAGTYYAIVLADNHADGLVITGVGATLSLGQVEAFPFNGLALDRPLTTDNAADTSIIITLSER